MTSAFSSAQELTWDDREVAAQQLSGKQLAARNALHDLELRFPDAFKNNATLTTGAINTGIPEINRLCGGVPRGSLSEIVGNASSGRTTVMMNLLHEVTECGEVCALIDVSDTFSPHAASALGVDMGRLLWVRCTKEAQPKTMKGRLAPLEQAFKAADLLLNAGGLGLLVIDLGNIAHEVARKIPLASWFRLRRMVEHTKTALLVVALETTVGTCSALTLELRHRRLVLEMEADAPFHARLLACLESDARTTRLPASVKKSINSALSHVTLETKWNLAL